MSIHRGTGYWCKKVRGRIYYFGKVADDPKGTAALAEWERVREDLCAGREPAPKSGELTVADILNTFLNSKRGSVETGDLTARTFAGYIAVGEMMVEAFGRGREVDSLRAEDFEKLRAAMAKRSGPVQLGNLVQKVRTVFNLGLASGWIDRDYPSTPCGTRSKRSVPRRAMNWPYRP